MEEERLMDSIGPIGLGNELRTIVKEFNKRKVEPEKEKAWWNDLVNSLIELANKGHSSCTIVVHPNGVDELKNHDTISGTLIITGEEECVGVPLEDFKLVKSALELEGINCSPIHVWPDFAFRATW